MTITSLDFVPNQTIPIQYTCQGVNVSPSLEFHDIPSNATSLALVLHDPDAPGPAGFDHWLVYNIKPTKKKLGPGEVGFGVLGVNDAGEESYVGPCPPHGEHRYVFTLYALDQMLDLKPGAKKNELDQAMKRHILAQAELTGRYQKK